MALNNLGLGFVFTARNLATGTINRLRGQLGGLAGQSKLAGLAMKAGFALAAGGVANLLVGLTMLGGAFALADAAGNFEQQMNLLGQLSRRTGEDLERLRDSAIEAGLATQFSPDEAVEGLRGLITAGRTAEQAMEELTPTLQIATFGMISVAEASDAMMSAMNGFPDSGLNAQQVADQLAMSMARTNLQAVDFGIALSAVASQANSASQTLETTLTSLGLLRNRAIGASRAGTAFREALRRLSSDTRSQAEAQRLLGQEGIFSDGGQGRMRNIIDIMGDLQQRLGDVSEAERNRSLQIMLGAKGVQLYEAIAGARYRRTLADGTTELLRGAEAARAYEQEVRSSAGVADRLQRAVSEGNYQGVLNVLRGVAQTFEVEVGRPFAEVLVPVLVMFRDGLTAVTNAFRALPRSLQRAVAGGILFSGVIFTAAGIAGLLVAALVLIIPVLDTIAIAVGVLVLAMAPFIAAVGAMGGAIVGFYQLVRLNVGGIVDFFSKAWGRIRLAFQALSQLFSQGGFSGEVRDEMNRAENGGIRRFVINVFRIGMRIKQFFDAIKTGFSFAARAMGPRVQGMLQAFQRLGEALGFVGYGAKGLADTDMNSWAETGARVGGILADVLGYIVDGIRRTTIVVTAIVDYLTGAWDRMSPFFNNLFEEVGQLASEFQALFTDLNVMSGDSQSGMMSMGEIFGAMAEGIIVGIVQIVRAVVWLIRKIVWLGRVMARAKATITDGFTILSIRIQTVFANMVDSIRNSLDQVLVFIGRLVGRIPAGFRPEGLDNIVRVGMDAEGRINQRNENIAVRTAAGRVEEATRGTVNTRAFEAQARAQAQARDRQMEEAVRALTLERERDRKEAQRPIEVHIDGERVATAVAGANRREGARGFVPVPADS